MNEIAIAIRPKKLVTFLNIELAEFHFLVLLVSDITDVA